MHSASRLPELSQTSIHDPLWSRYTDMVANIIVPYQWEVLNDRVVEAGPTYCLANFRVVAAGQGGRHQGALFADTDLYKWLETVAYCIQNGTGARFIPIAEEAISLIGRAQQPDGYLHTFYTLTEPEARWSNLVEGHELYGAGHLIEAAVAYSTATGRDELLTIACRFADLICQEFGPGQEQRKGYPGHQEIELALIKLYRYTGVKRYLSCARFFIDQRGQKPNYFSAESERIGIRTLIPEFNNYDLKYSQAHIPPVEQITAEGHAVRAMYMYCAMADLAQEEQDQDLQEACRRLWRNVTGKRMYITGGIGSSGFLERFTTDYDLPNASAYCETCASIGLALFGRRMAALEKDARYYDIVERALYNTVLAGISAEGDRYFYVNPLEVWPDACQDATSMQHVKATRQRWFNVSCCPTNVARTLASLGQYIYALDDQTVYVNLFISSTFNATLAGAEVKLNMDSRLMQDGKIMIQVEGGTSPLSRLAVRLPDYAEEPRIFIDGEPEPLVLENGYIMLSSGLAGQHTIELDLHVKPRWMAANPLVREDAGKVALMKGPCVYCLEEIDNGSNLAAVFVRQETAVAESADPSLPAGLPVLTYAGKKLNRTGCEENQLYGRVRFSTEPVQLKAVAYGVWGNRKPGEMLVWQKVNHID